MSTALKAFINSPVGPKTTHFWDLLQTGFSLLRYAIFPSQFASLILL
jgi:hypothetical protein